jgi:hypothetical protein
MNAMDLIDRLKRFLNSPDPIRATLRLDDSNRDAVEELVALLDGHSKSLAAASDEAYDRAAFVARHAKNPHNAMHAEALEAAQKKKKKHE